MRLMMCAALPLIGCVATVGTAQESTFEDFQAYCQAMEGRWVGDVIWVADWAGFGKKGEKVVCYAENRIVADGKVLMGQFYGGPGTGHWLTVYDSAKKKIIETAASSGGGVTYSVIFKKDGKWVSRYTGNEADGKAVKGTSTLTISDNGKTHTWTGSGTVGDEPMLDQHDVWRRVRSP